MHDQTVNRCPMLGINGSHCILGAPLAFPIQPQTSNYLAKTARFTLDQVVSVGLHNRECVPLIASSTNYICPLCSGKLFRNTLGKEKTSRFILSEYEDFTIIGKLLRATVESVEGTYFNKPPYS